MVVARADDKWSFSWKYTKTCLAAGLRLDPLGSLQLFLTPPALRGWGPGGRGEEKEVRSEKERDGEEKRKGRKIDRNGNFLFQALKWIALRPVIELLWWKSVDDARLDYDNVNTAASLDRHQYDADSS